MDLIKMFFALVLVCNGSGSKESACNAGDLDDPWIRNIPWRREWLRTPVFLSGESHGQRSLAGYSPSGRKESGMTEHQAHVHTTYPQSSLSTAFVVQGEALEFSVWNKRETLSVSLS